VQAEVVKSPGKGSGNTEKYFFQYLEKASSHFGIFDCFLYFCSMRIIAFRTIREFWEKPEYVDSETSLRSWYHDVKRSDWKNTNDLKQQYKNASVLGDGRIVFNIKGNSYRLIVLIDYDFQIIFIRFIGTHYQYDRIDAKTI
jgi:mRNA interferase HigB